MENKRRNRRENRKNNDGLFKKLFAHTGGNPEDIEDQDWYLDTPDIRLTRVFSVVLVLHIIAVGGILAFKMIDKATGPGSVSLSKATVTPRKAVPAESEFAAKMTPKPVKVNVPSVFADRAEDRKDRYCVLPGDNLSQIAAKLGVTTDELKTTNHIQSPDEILPGMWLKIPVEVAYDDLPDHPVEVTGPDKTRNEAPKQKIPGRNRIVYQVLPGDTAWRISQKHGINYNDLLKHNGISDPRTLQVGQLLNIPEK